MIKNSIERAHARLLHEIQADFEPIQVVKAVELHRQYWRPKICRVVLLAESHVRTQFKYLKSIEYPRRYAHLELPPPYVRFVYCLAHGEKELTPEGVPKSRNPAQFWKLLLSCVKPVSTRKDFAPVLSTKTSASERLNNKISLLLELKKSGIWLVDASIAGLYSVGGEKSSSSIVKSAINICWDEHVKPQLDRYGFDFIICIGEGVAATLKEKLQDIAKGKYTSVPQPQGWRRKGQDIEVANEVWSICKKYTK